MRHDFDVPSNWYEQFFTAPVNRFWEAMVPPEATAADLDFVLRHIGVAPPARLLDLPCGAGRHALGLAARGYKVTGVDISEDAIQRASAAGAGLPARFLRADMRDFRAPAPFDAILCLGNSVAYFDVAGMGAFFAGLAANLRPGGRLVLDSYSCAESLLPLVEEREIAFPGGRYGAELAYDPLRSVLKTRAELTLDGDTHQLLYAHQVVTSGELVRLLGAAGLAVEALYADSDDAPYAPGCSRLLLTATRS
jgi:cyclopropane fatty-acyl-phospholipid synthase-like methyltransferase